MNKILKTIFISLIAIFSVGFLFILPTNAQPAPFIVEYSTDGVVNWLPLSGPIFSQANFLPGDSVTRLIRVTNNSVETQRIATEAINYPGFPNSNNVPIGDLSRALSIIIREKGGSDLYGGPTGEKTLFDFYRKFGFNSAYEHVLTQNLPGNGGKVTYEFVIIFPFEKGNEWQAATTTSDILIGYQASEEVESASGGGSYAFIGGGGYPGQYVTTTTVPPTTTTKPGEVHGEATEREFFEEVGEEGTTTTTTAPPSKFVAGISTIGPFSCPVNLTMTGINPLLASLLCLGQNACDTCLNPLIILLLGIVITLGSTILVKKYYG